MVLTGQRLIQIVVRKIRVQSILELTGKPSTAKKTPSTRYTQIKCKTFQSNGWEIPPKSKSTRLIKTCRPSNQRSPRSFSVVIKSSLAYNSISIMDLSTQLMEGDTILRCIQFTLLRRRLMEWNTQPWELCSLLGTTMLRLVMNSSRLLMISLHLCNGLNLLERPKQMRSHTETSWWWSTWTIDGHTKGVLQHLHAQHMFTGMYSLRSIQSSSPPSTTLLDNLKELQTILIKQVTGVRSKNSTSKTQSSSERQNHQRPIQSSFLYWSFSQH